LSRIDANSDWETSVVSSHFHQFSVSDFDKLSFAVLEAILSDSKLVLADEDLLFEVVHRRASADLAYFGLLEFVRFEFLSEDCMAKAVELISNSFELLTFGIWSSLRTRLTFSATATPLSEPGRFLALPPIDSTIISSIPDIFSVFGAERLKLLYRASRDGFETSAFHDRCNGHSNTVTLVSSSKGWIFGGYTPLPWSSREGASSDPSLRSCIFTIKNPHNLAPRIFKLKQQENAIYNHLKYGPRFGDGMAADLWVCGESFLANSSVLGMSYINNTGIEGSKVLAGSSCFSPNEIEVFEVI
jgi:hypothetical protein